MTWTEVVMELIKVVGVLSGLLALAIACWHLSPEGDRQQVRVYFFKGVSFITRPLQRLARKKLYYDGRIDVLEW